MGSGEYDPRALGALCDICPLKDVHVPVPARGPKNAKVMILGEAPGRNEILQGKAFVGDSGRMLPDLLSEAHRLLPPGIPKVKMSDIRIVNTLEHKPSSGDIMKYLSGLKAKNADERKRYSEALKDLRSRLKLSAKELKLLVAEGSDPRLPSSPVVIPSPVDCCWPRVWREIQGRAVIIPVGALALSVLDPKRSKILRWRGSPFRLDPNILSGHETTGSDNGLRSGSDRVHGDVRGVRSTDHVRAGDRGDQGVVGSGPSRGIMRPLFD